MPPRKASKKKAPKAKAAPVEAAPVDDEPMPDVDDSAETKRAPTESMTVEVEPSAQEAAVPESPDPSSSKGVAATIADAAHAFVETMTAPDGGEAVEKKLSLEERKAKLNQLRSRMQTTARDNRADLISESTRIKSGAREAARHERQLKLAETLRLNADAAAAGEDADRIRNWDYTIEENDAWEKRLARKARRADFEFHSEAHSARRRYKKDLELLKPDLVAYNRQKEVAMGLAPGTLVRSAGASASGGSGSDPKAGSLELVPTSEQQRLAAEHLYRDANSLLYADNKPSEEAIDRVVGKLNLDLHRKGKFSRKRLNEDDGDITYINERNRVFNKKIARYYDKYTEEIRASFERGTAL